MEQGSTIDQYILPEGCISDILSLTSPLDACRSSIVCSIFRSAADSDSVWQKFLPSDIQQILSSSVCLSLPTFSSNKELFLYLCDNPLLIDNGSKSFALEKCSGKKCYMIAAKELSIIWGNTANWNWRPLPESRFSEVAELSCMCWLEIRGKMETRLLSPNTMYGAYLVLKFTDGAYGFEFPPAEVSVKLASGGGGGDKVKVKSVYLNPVGRERRQREVNRGNPPLEGQVPKERGDGWMEIEMGEFFNERGEDGDVEMSLMEVKGGLWKSGLIIQGIELRPKERTIEKQ